MSHIPLKKISYILSFIILCLLSLMVINTTAYAAYSDVDASLSRSYKSTSALNNADMKDNTQKNYQGVGADNNYIFESAEWTNQDSGEAKVSVFANQDAEGISEEITAVYFLNPCLCHGQTLDLVKKDVKWLIEKYGALDVVMYTNETYKNYCGSVGEYTYHHYTTATMSEVDAWENGGELGLYGIKINGVDQPHIHASGAFAVAARTYFFGSQTATPSEENLIHNPSVVYTSSDGYITYGVTAPELAAATDDLFRFLADKYVTGLDKKRWYSTTSQQSVASYAGAKTNGVSRITSASFNPENWFKTEMAYDADYHYEQSFETVGAEVVYPDYTISGTISDKFDIVSSSFTYDGVPVTPKITGNDIEISVAGYQGGEVSGTISLKLKDSGWSASNSWIDINSTPFSSSYSSDIKCMSPKLAIVSDLHITKAVSQSKAQAGDVLSYTLSITNKGKGIAQQANIVDNLPSGLIISGQPTTTNGEVNVSSDKKTLNIRGSNVKPGDTFTVKYTAEVQSSASGTLTNTVKISGNGQEERSASASVSVIKPSLSITKTADKTTYQKDDIVEYTVTVTNTEPDTTAHQTQITDTLPADIILQDEITSNKGSASVDSSSNSWTLNIGDLAYNSSVKVSYKALVGKDADNTKYTNTASCSALYTELVQASNTIEILFPVLSITKTAQEHLVQNDDTIHYDIKVENLGTGEARNVKIKDVIPSEIELGENISMDFYSLSGSTSDTSLTFNTVWLEGEFTADLNAPLPSQSGIILHISTTVNGDTQPCMISNTASVTCDNFDEISSTDNTVQVVAPELKITKTSTANGVQIGDTVPYRVVVQNFGEGEARNVVAADEVPEEFSLVPESLEYTERDLIVIEDDKIDAVIPGFDGNDIDDDWVGTDEWVNNEDNENEDDTYNTGQDLVPPTPDIMINTMELFDEDTEVTGEGDLFEGEDSDIEDEDNIDNDIDQSTPNYNGGSDEFSIDGNNWTLQLNHPLPSQKEIVITFDTIVNEIPSTTVTNIATADASHVDLLTAKDSLIDSCTVEIIEPELTISKTVDKEFAQSGDILSYKVSVSNTGNGEARNVVINDILPQSVDITGDVIVSKEEAKLEVENDKFMVSLSKLDSNSSIDITYQGIVSGNVEMGEELTNIANTHADYVEEVTNTATTLALIPGMNIIKTASVEEAMPGDNFSYTISVIQNGDEGSVEHNLVIKDKLPSGIIFNGAYQVSDEKYGKGTISGDDFEFSIPTLTQGESLNITLPVTTADSSVAGQTIVNTATLSSDETDTLSSSASVNFGTPATPVPVPQKMPTPQSPVSPIPQLPKTGELILISGAIIAIIGLSIFAGVRFSRKKRTQK